MNTINYVDDLVRNMDETIGKVFYHYLKKEITHQEAASKMGVSCGTFTRKLKNFSDDAIKKIKENKSKQDRGIKMIKERLIEEEDVLEVEALLRKLMKEEGFDFEKFKTALNMSTDAQSIEFTYRHL